MPPNGPDLLFTRQELLNYFTFQYRDNSHPTKYSFHRPLHFTPTHDHPWVNNLREKHNSTRSLILEQANEH